MNKKESKNKLVNKSITESLPRHGEVNEKKQHQKLNLKNFKPPNNTEELEACGKAKQDTLCSGPLRCSGRKPSRMRTKSASGGVGNAAAIVESSRGSRGRVGSRTATRGRKRNAQADETCDRKNNLQSRPLARDNINIGTVEELPLGNPMETPLHPKRRRNLAKSRDHFKHPGHVERKMTTTPKAIQTSQTRRRPQKHLLDDNNKICSYNYEVLEQHCEEDVMHLEVVQNVEIEIIQEQAEGGRGEEEAADITRIEKENIKKRGVDFSSAPSTSKQNIWDGVNDKDFHEVTDERLRITDDLSDCDMDIDDEEFLGTINNMVSHNAFTEPSVPADLTPYETHVLNEEDRLNDVAIREFATDDCYDFKWTTNRQSFTGRRENFTGTAGPTFPVNDQTRIVDIFFKMIDVEFIDRACTETNRYADQKIQLLKDQNKYLQTTRLYRWVPTDRDEIISFLAIIILQGLYPLPEEESYFRFNGFGTMPYFSRIMSYNRFILIKSMLHFNNNETITEPNKLSKIQFVSDYFNDKFSNMYYPSQDIVIDESLLKWHGRLGFAQKILSKAAKVGVKTYELCESASGYLWKFFIYVGKDKTRTATTTKTDDVDVDDTDKRPDETETHTDTRPSNATAKIVYDLVEPLLYRGHTLIMDNFYNSPLLARCLKRQQTDCYGTIRLNREFVPDSFKTLTKTELRPGEVMASYCTDLAIIVWRDANLVSLISTYHDLQIGTRQKYNRLTHKPTVVLSYNKAMGGVDRKDQFLSAQPLERTRNKKWYKKVFRRLYNTAIFNCFVIFNSFHSNISHRQFRTILAEDLLKIHRHIDLTTEPRLINIRPGVLTRTQPKRVTNRPQLEHRHFPVKNGFKQSRCWMCAQKKVAARTVWKCMECNVNLCIEICFMQYHI